MTRGSGISAVSLLILLGIVAIAPSNARAAITEQEFRARVEEATNGLKDLTMVGTVAYKNEKALAKIDTGYARLYGFKSATVSLKQPDKLRMEGKLGMVKFEYIINGGTKIFRAPKVKINKQEDYSDDPAKLQDALDIGLITHSLWRSRRVEIIDDAEAAANSEIKLRLYWPKGDMVYLAWVDARDLYLKRFEKRNGANTLLVRMEYSNPKRVGDVVWMPTRVDMFTSDGEKAGTSEAGDIKVNSGIPDSLFE